MAITVTCSRDIDPPPLPLLLDYLPPAPFPFPHLGVPFVECLDVDVRTPPLRHGEEGVILTPYHKTDTILQTPLHVPAVINNLSFLFRA